ncbi:MAG TPA: pyridoxal kinase [Spirochaetaceae bacterium]|nr:pyridoxal kinase [Spirochaetaceae bacterium]
MTVLSIQSHVVCGHVGNRSAVFPLERMGHEVWPLNTVQFSSHTGKPGWRGASFGADHLGEILTALQASGKLKQCSAVLSGYIGDAATGRAILEAVAAVKEANPDALYCCDPVMGDAPDGFYVRPDVPGFFAREACALADIVTPNQFEAEVLSGIVFAGGDDAARIAAAIHELGPKIVLITSFSHGQADGSLGFYLSCPAGRYQLLTPRLPFPKPPKGSGDLLSALFLGNFLGKGDAVDALERASSSLYTVLEATLASGDDNLAIIGAQAAIAEPPARFKASEPTFS